MSEDVFDGAGAGSSPTYADGDVGLPRREHHNANAPLCSNSEFLGHVLAGANGYGWVCAFAGNPGSDDPGKWYGRPWVPNPANDAVVDSWHSQNTYFAVAELEDVDGKRARQKQYFKRLRVLVVDDAVTGAYAGDPSYVIATSPGKVQVGVFIDVTDIDAANPGLVDAIMQELYRRKLLGDSSGNNLVRYVRLPVGTNAKPRDSGDFEHQLLFWNPKQVLSLADACAVFGIDLDEIRKGVKPVAADAVIFTGEGQDKLFVETIQNVVKGVGLHDSMNRLAASLSKSGAHPGAQVNLLRALMLVSAAPRDGRWQERWNDIPRTVDTGSKKFQVAPLAAPGEAAEKPPLLRRVGDGLNDVKPIEWVVQDWVEANALSMLYGAPNVGKSFIVYDIACSVATGTPWRGRKVKQGPVVIVIGEGGAGFNRRLRAWEIENGVSLTDASLYVTERAVPMLDRESALELVAAIDAVVVASGGVTPALIVIDTLARNFGAGDENSTKDAGAFIDVVDALLRRRYRANVIVIHHSGKDVAAGARGSSAFKGAMDQEFSVTAILGGTLIKFAATKMKDAPLPPPKEFKLKSVVLARNEADEPITSAVMELAGSVLDEVIYTATGNKNITLGQVLRMQEDGVVPTQRALAAAFEIGAGAPASAIHRRLQDGGWAEKGKHSTAQLKVTKKALMALSRAGLLISSDNSDGGDSE